YNRVQICHPMTCTQCSRILPETEFTPRKSRDGKRHPWCRDCLRAYWRKRYHENPEPWRRANIAWKTRHPEAFSRMLRKATLKQYGLSLEEYEAIFHSQAGKCAICGDTTKERLCVDHDHATGRVRALLCRPCNIALSQAKESRDVLAKMIKYLEEHGAN